jgi:hypothetical protein
MSSTNKSKSKKAPLNNVDGSDNFPPAKKMRGEDSTPHSPSMADNLELEMIAPVNDASEDEPDPSTQRVADDEKLAKYLQAEKELRTRLKFGQKVPLEAIATKLGWAIEEASSIKELKMHRQILARRARNQKAARAYSKMADEHGVTKDDKYIMRPLLSETDVVRIAKYNPDSSQTDDETHIRNLIAAEPLTTKAARTLAARIEPLFRTCIKKAVRQALFYSGNDGVGTIQPCHIINTLAEMQPSLNHCMSGTRPSPDFLEYCKSTLASDGKTIVPIMQSDKKTTRQLYKDSRRAYNATNKEKRTKKKK